MRLTTFTDYALRTLIHVATAPSGRSTIAGIAGAYGISESHVVKVVHSLARAGFLDTTRGRGGGIELARAPGEVKVGTIVRYTEGADIPAECFEPGNPACTIASACRLSGVLHEATTAFHRVLDNYTLADLVRESKPLAALLHPNPLARLREA